MSLASASSLCCAVLVALLRWRNKPLSFTRVPFRQGSCAAGTSWAQINNGFSGQQVQALVASKGVLSAADQTPHGVLPAQRLSVALTCLRSLPPAPSPALSLYR